MSNPNKMKKELDCLNPVLQYIYTFMISPHAAHSFSKVHAAFAGLVDGSVTASIPVSGS